MLSEEKIPPHSYVEDVGGSWLCVSCGIPAIYHHKLVDEPEAHPDGWWKMSMLMEAAAWAGLAKNTAMSEKDRLGAALEAIKRYEKYIEETDAE